MSNETPSRPKQGVGQLLTAVQAAERFGLSIWNLYHLAISREISSVKIGRRRLFEAVELESYISRHRVPALPNRSAEPGASHGRGRP